MMSEQVGSDLIKIHHNQNNFGNSTIPKNYPFDKVVTDGIQEKEENQEQSRSVSMKDSFSVK